MAQKPDFRDPSTAARTKKNVQQTRAVYGQFMDAMTQAPGKWLNVMPSSEMTSWFEAVPKKAVRFAKQNACSHLLKSDRSDQKFSITDNGIGEPIEPHGHSRVSG
jgi:hypothetical protein